MAGTGNGVFRIDDETCRQILCNDLDEASCQWILDIRCDETTSVLGTPVDLHGFADVPVTYVRLLLDQTLPLEQQDRAIAAVGAVRPPEVVELRPVTWRWSAGPRSWPRSSTPAGAERDADPPPRRRRRLRPGRPVPGRPAAGDVHRRDLLRPRRATLVNEERGMLGYTGTFEGRPISVQSTGMGSPTIGIVAEELVMLGVRRMIRVGTCGAIGAGHGDGRHGDRDVGHRRRRDGPLRYAGVPGWAPTATFGLVETAVRLSREAGATVHVGPIVTSGIFYEPDETLVPRWQRLGHPRHRDGGVDAVHGGRRARRRGAGDDDGQRPRRGRARTSACGSATRTSPRGVDAMMRLACQVAVA